MAKGRRRVGGAGRCPFPELHCFDIIYAYLWVWLALTSTPPSANPLSSLKTVIKLILCSSEAGRGRIQGYRRGFAENEEMARGEAIKNHLKHSKCRMRMGEVKVDKR